MPPIEVLERHALLAGSAHRTDAEEAELQRLTAVLVAAGLTPAPPCRRR